MLRPLIATLLTAALSLAAWADPAAEVSATLDNFHDAAAKADGERYFSLLTDDAIFLGTDASERWSKAEFQAFARPFFDRGRGWTYTKTSRHIYFSADGDTAWFDETLSNDNYGECRGSGVLVRHHQQWQISQYHLVIPVPNPLAAELVEKTRQLQSSGQTSSASKK